jgi:hypothetical protein
MLPRKASRDAAAGSEQDTIVKGLCHDDHTEASQIAITISKHAHLQRLRDGETRTRTGDTTIFSRVLYQLSYLAGSLMLADAELRHQRGVRPAQPLGDRDLGAPAELTLGAGDVQAAVLQLARA